MNLFLKFLFFFLEYGSVIVLSLAAFRLNIRYQLHKIAVSSIMMSIVSIYIRDYLNQTTLAFLPTLVVEIIFFVILFRLPILFSFLITLLGTLASSTLEIASGWILNEAALVTYEMLQENPIPVQLSTFILNLLIAKYILYRKIGFHFTTRDSLKGYNFYLSASLVIAVVLLQINIYFIEQNYVNSIILLTSATVLLICIYLSYKHNIRLWKERRERLEKR
ncbi:hypothetical protein [Paenibacillus elgii]|uniref:hypothetical protein n=1 Tax=Paenibacillus elgii TaxID=189691 RepID=UPI000FD6864F|nr:hypothetical protein [Paenibacillus elgii]NEN82954.1 hypothetical protein [Paenibacillus elgii]